MPSKAEEYPPRTYEDYMNNGLKSISQLKIGVLQTEHHSMWLALLSEVEKVSTPMLFIYCGI